MGTYKVSILRFMPWGQAVMRVEIQRFSLVFLSTVSCFLIFSMTWTCRSSAMWSWDEK